MSGIMLLCAFCMLLFVFVVVGGLLGIAVHLLTTESDEFELVEETEEMEEMGE